VLFICRVCGQQYASSRHVRIVLINRSHEFPLVMPERISPRSVPVLGRQNNAGGAKSDMYCSRTLAAR
jgi:hypothetical protein